VLYDKALLGRVDLDAFRLTGRPLYERVVHETLDFVARELRDPAGGFYSTLDADSEGVEGKFYVWSLAGFSEAVGRDAGELARYLDVTEGGNFEGANILNVPAPNESSGSLPADARRRLFERRETRVRPGRDEKILTDWNGLMLRTYAEAAACLDRADYREIAEANAAFLLDRMWDGARLLHAFKDGEARFNGYLDDYANLADGLLALYELTFDEAWLDHAVRLSERMISEFEDTESDGFFFTGKSHETLVARTKEFFDNATPSGNSMAAGVLLRIGVLLDRPDFREKAQAICHGVVDYVRRFPSAFGQMLTTIDFLVGPSRELALAGDPRPFLPAVREGFQPRLVVAAGSSDRIPLLARHPPMDGKPTAYLCENYACREPTTEPEALLRMLAGS
jgi:hypothetical protein